MIQKQKEIPITLYFADIVGLCLQGSMTVGE